MEGCASLFKTLGSSAFPTALIQQFRQLCPAVNILIVAYKAERKPRILYFDLVYDQIEMSTRYFTRGPYRSDPFFLACENGIASGVYRQSELTSPDFRRSAYYQKYYRHLRLSEEIGLIVSAGPDQKVVVYIDTDSEDVVISAAEIDALQIAFPVFEAAILSHWHRELTLDDAAIPAALTDSGAWGQDRGNLSPREQQVIELILSGHSVHAISEHLAISEGTVKVHRKNIYAKLNVSSQAELFALLLTGTRQGQLTS